MENIEEYFKYNGLQELNNDGKGYRRYEFVDSLQKITHISALLRKLYAMFKNNKSFDGYPIHEIVFTFNGAPRQVINPVELWFNDNFSKYESFFNQVFNCIDDTGLHIEHGVVWTYPDKQQGRKNLNSWRKEVLKDNVCICCGGDKHLEAHHIFGYAANEDLRDDPNNGVVLCKWCHKKYHSYYPGDANPKDLIEYIKRFGGKYE